MLLFKNMGLALKTLFILSAITILVASAPNVTAHADEVLGVPQYSSNNYSQYDDQSKEQSWIDVREDKIVYEFAGDAEEEGALRFFLKNARDKLASEGPNANDLNDISPAAGIQINFEF